ncbi:naringenin 8-dimethylallyltransferase 1, chloroplastic [Cajanus cajan]|uniref:naringenin 8-dimethylallyltransferase 1, chloroplastic n=1 Tax=Cajanus cajan TaxID=3821 RepID=UPI0010FADB10|nr:naringenin 8-dimethylallyltransferase 1, chloroplastic [Cajanus cajan]
MASMLLGSFSLASSLTTGCHVTNASFYKSRKIRNEYPIMRHEKQNNLKHDYRLCIEAASTGKECARSNVVNVAPGESFESEPQDPRPKSLLASTKDAINILTRFMRPVAAIVAAVNITSSALLAVENFSDISPTFFIGLLKALVAIFPMNIFVVALNDLADYEIDKINKPNLPFASGDCSFETITTIVVSSAILSFGLAWIVGSPPLFWVIFSHFIAASVYSINLPLLRWKKSSVLSALNFILDRAIILQLGIFLHMQTHVFKRPIMIPKSLIFALVVMSLITAALSFFKDIPDTEGDKKFGIRNFAVVLGQERVWSSHLASNSHRIWLCPYVSMGFP